MTRTLCLLLAFAAATPTGLMFTPVSSPARRTSAACDARPAGMTLPTGFCATVFADSVGVARHFVVAPNGDVFVRMEGPRSTSQMPRGRRAPGVVALRDTNGDGRADVMRRFGDDFGTGIALRDTLLYVSTSEAVMRYVLPRGALVPTRGPDTIVTDIPEGPGHRSRSLALDDRGGLFVSVGSNSNVCRASRNETAPDPCPELPVRSGIWRYDANRLRQKHPQDGARYATGIRNAVAMHWNPAERALFALSHGRDGLSNLFPRMFSLEKNADTPSEEMMRVTAGQDYGWPYCYHDRELNRKVLAPEYGGDGRTAGRCADKANPILAFPGHWGPNGLWFYRGTQFPERYRGGAFIAFHGSWNRMPLAEAGYNVAFAPFRNGQPTGRYEIFADGFAGDTLEPILARHRPMGLGEGPDGALFLSDDQRGRIWKIVWRPDGPRVMHH
jgi:glucose/arabinose dehydrogenase